VRCVFGEPSRTADGTAVTAAARIGPSRGLGRTTTAVTQHGLGRAGYVLCADALVRIAFAGRDVGMRSVQTVVAPVAAVLAVVVYALMWLGFHCRWGWLAWLDRSSLQVFYDVGLKHPVWIRFWDSVCTVFGPNAFRLLGAVAVVVALAKHRLRVALFLVATMECSGLITEIAKLAAHRPRPVTTLSNASSWSFPSGHALGVMVCVLALLIVLVPVLSHWMRVVTVALSALIIAAVGFGRVALNAHHVSDVLAGWALGYVYFLLCFLAFRPLRRN